MAAGTRVQIAGSHGTIGGPSPRARHSELRHGRNRLGLHCSAAGALGHDVAGLKDDTTVVMARLDRLDATTHSLVTEVRALHSRHDRIAKRVKRFEEAERDAPS